MLPYTSRQNWIAFIAIVGMMYPAPLARCKEFASSATVDHRSIGTGPDHVAHTFLDLAIDESRILRGWVMSTGGQPWADIDVQLRKAGHKIRTTKSTLDGHFAIPGVRGGVYQLVVGENIRLVRVWAPGTAPPSARSHALVTMNPVMRGQMHPAATMMGNPWIITGLVAAAVIIPVAIDNNRADRPSGS